MRKRAIGLGLVLLAAASATAAEARPVSAEQASEAKEILKKAVGFRTVAGEKQVPAFAAYLASILKAAGYADGDMEITPIGETATLTATLKGTTREKPILVIGHMDVVAAKPEDWERDPFTAIEENGMLFGRGAQDNKYDLAMIVSTMARLKKEGFRPRRDIILAFTGDEETDMTTTAALAKRFGNAELVLNGDSGGGLLSTEGKPVIYRFQAGEKVYADFEIAFSDPGGHSSAPTKTNPIYRLVKALDRISAFQFPNQINELTRASLLSTSQQIGGEVGAAMARYAADPTDTAAAETIAAYPQYIGQIRTTCTATMVNAGHAPNALPQRAAANVNCRILPGNKVEAVQAELARLVADDSAKITLTSNPLPSDASPLRKDVTDAITKAVHARYPGLAISPSMSAGATDSMHFRNLGIPAYGVSSLFSRVEDSFAHGLNERVPVNTIPAALKQWHDLLTDIGSR